MLSKVSCLIFIVTAIRGPDLAQVTTLCLNVLDHLCKCMICEDVSAFGRSLTLHLLSEDLELLII